MGVPGLEPEPAALVAEVAGVVVLARLEVVETGRELDTAVLVLGAAEDVEAPG